MTSLVGRTTTGIQRIGDTVHRPAGAHSEFVHAVLRHLEARGFAGAPRYLGTERGVEILSFLPGEVPQELGWFSSDQFTAGARLLREFHDLTSDFEGLGSQEVVCHGDVSPCNFVFRDGLPIGLIDFDAAHRGTRRQDVGYAAWLWLDLGNADYEPTAQGRRLREFIDAYGAFDWLDALPAVIDAQTELSLRAAAPQGTREWAEGCRRWSTANGAGLTAGLTSPNSA